MSGKFYCDCYEARAIYEMPNKDKLLTYRKGFGSEEYYCQDCNNLVKYKTSIRSHFIMIGMIVAVGYGMFGMVYGGLMLIENFNMINVVLLATGMIGIAVPKLVVDTFQRQVDVWEERGVKISKEFKR